MVLGRLASPGNPRLLRLHLLGARFKGQRCLSGIRGQQINFVYTINNCRIPKIDAETRFFRDLRWHNNTKYMTYLSFILRIPSEKNSTIAADSSPFRERGSHETLYLARITSTLSRVPEHENGSKAGRHGEVMDHESDLKIPFDTFFCSLVCKHKIEFGAIV